MLLAQSATRGTPQIDYNAIKSFFFALGATGHQKLDTTQPYPIRTTKEPRMSEQEQSSKAQDIPQLCSVPVRCSEALSIGKWFHMSKLMVWMISNPESMTKTLEKFRGTGAMRLWRNWSVHFCSGTSKRWNRPRKTARTLTLLEGRRHDKGLALSKPMVMCAAALRLPTGPCRRHCRRASSPSWPMTTKQTHAQATSRYKTTKQTSKPEAYWTFFLPLLLDFIILHYFSTVTGIQKIYKNLLLQLLSPYYSFHSELSTIH